jgi:hypothetical protein
MIITRQRNPAMTRKKVNRYLGISLMSICDEALARIKQLMVSARRNEDDETSKLLRGIWLLCESQQPYTSLQEALACVSIWQKQTINIIARLFVRLVQNFFAG